MVEPEQHVGGKAARNEQRKAFATTCNAVSVAILVSAFLQPLAAGRPDPSAMLLTLAIFIALQALLHYFLAQVED